MANAACTCSLRWSQTELEFKSKNGLRLYICRVWRIKGQPWFGRLIKSCTMHYIAFQTPVHFQSTLGSRSLEIHKSFPWKLCWPWAWSICGFTAHAYMKVYICIYIYIDKKLSGDPTAAMVTGRNKIGEVTKRLAAMGIPKAAWPNGLCFNKGDF